MVKQPSSVLVAVSTVADGTMLDKTRPFDAQIVANRRRWLDTLAVDIENAAFVPLKYEGEDYCRYRIVDDVRQEQGLVSGDSEPADALITTVPGLALFLPVADCIATTIFDPVHGVLMLSHLGRHSLEQQGGVRSVEFLTQHFGSNPKDLQVWLSPSVGKDSYQIYALNNLGMKEALHMQLAEAGIDTVQITDLAHDTATHNDYYSHSAFLKGDEAKNGRFAMVAMILPE